MTVVTLPRRDATRPDTARPDAVRPRATHHRPRRVRALWLGRSVPRRAAIIVAGALVLIMGASSYVAERQVQLHSLQSEVLTSQAHYAAQVAAITQMATPARVAAEAGRLHLIEPTSVTQVTPVPLTARLPLVRLRGDDVVTPRDDS